MQFIKLAFVVTSYLVSRSAAAQPGQPEQPGQPAQPAAVVEPAKPAQSVLPNVLSTSVGTTFDGRIDYSHFGEGAPALFALNLRIQSLLPVGGGYLSLPIALGVGAGASEMSVGNPEVGVLGVLRKGDVHLYVRGGLALGALGRGAESTSGLLPLLVNLVPRPADAIASGMDANIFRTGVGLRVTRGPLVIGGSGGLDLPLDEDTSDSFLNLSGSIGIARPSFGLAVGATLLQIVDTSGSGGRLVGLQAIADAPVDAGVRIYAAVGATDVIGEGNLDAHSVGIGLRAGL